MPKRTIDGVLDVMDSLKSQGFEKQCTKADVLRTISLLIGDKAETRSRNIDFMQRHGFMKITERGEQGDVCELDHEKAAGFQL